MRFLFLKLPLSLIRILFYLVVFLSPVLGVWLASSLVAYINGPKLLAVFSGILLFPLAPILWDLFRRNRQKGRNRRKASLLTWGDRITLRTLALNFAFIAILLALRPQISFLALSTRGDWFLDGMTGSQVELVRQGLFKLASGLEGLYLTFHNNPFEQYADSTQIQPHPSPETESPRQGEPHPSPETESPSQGEQPNQTESPKATAQANGWPWAGAGLHPAVVNMPASAETSIESVAQYIARQEPDPLLRVKALHDYVADRIAYDAPSFFAGRYPPQDAETVFKTRTAVCAGYAKLLEALGQAMGEEIVYVVGDARSSTSDLSGQGHAWNAVKVNGKWYLIDATWDSGSVDQASGFTKRYQSDYLFPPAEVMGVTHYPDNNAWQLRSQPISRGEFLRQPMMRPQFFAEGMKLLAPVRSQTDTISNATIELQNPNQRWLLASYAPKGSSQSKNCSDKASQGPKLACPLPSSGAYEVRLFSGDKQFGEFAYMGQMEFNKR